jgi:rubredoxin
MAKDHFMDFEGTAGFTWMAGWRCLNCGHIHDPVIERNRRMPRPVLQVAAEDCADEYQEDLLEEVPLTAHPNLDQAA